MTAGPADTDPDLGGLLAGCRPEVWGRGVLAVAAMHEPDRTGRCRFCRPERRGWRWWRWDAGPCPTRRMLLAEVVAASGDGTAA